MSLIFHPTTGDMIEQLRGNLPQSLLLSGDRGAGLMATAHCVAGGQIIAVVEPTDAKDTIDHDRGTIKIDAIRELYEQTRAKHTSRQVVIIDNADRMSHGAQNAFLKLLEEPNEYIHFILTAHNPRALLPTIHSRVQHVTLMPITSEQTGAFLKEQGMTDPKKMAQLRFIADGMPAELYRLLTDEAYFTARAGHMGDARTFIQGNSFDRLAVAFRYSTKRDTALQLLDSALVILRKSLSANPEPRLISQLERMLAAREAIDANHHARLQLTRLVV